MKYEIRNFSADAPWVNDLRDWITAENDIAKQIEQHGGKVVSCSFERNWTFALDETSWMAAIVLFQAATK